MKKRLYVVLSFVVIAVFLLSLNVFWNMVSGFIF